MSSFATSHCSDAADAMAGADLIDKLQGRWTLQILLCLNAGAQRFSDLRAAIPEVAANILTRRLRALESAGLVERRYLPPPAARQVYALATEGARLKAVLDALEIWRAVRRTAESAADRNQAAHLAPDSRLLTRIKRSLPTRTDKGGERRGRGLVVGRERCEGDESETDRIPSRGDSRTFRLRDDAQGAGDANLP
jgi:DNA-binding HxlR family transcriptional regulator